MLIRALGLLLATAATLAAQQPPAVRPADQSQTARFGAAASGVVVDVVVRDQKGRPVTNLTATDFEILEDSVHQKIVAFEPYSAADAPKSVDEAAAAAGVGGKAGGRSRLAEGPPIIALAWDRLEPEARAIAYKAARRLVETKAPSELVGVFVTDRTLQTIAPYTTDARRLTAAVEQLARTATTSVNRDAMPLDSFVRRAATSPTADASKAGMSMAGFPKQVIQPDDRASRFLLKALERMEAVYQQYLYEEQGRASMAGLLALVDSLGQLPGRKTVLYFCEGLTIPESQQARFKQVIDTANRNNVSAYTFDSAGLRVQSAQQQTAREVRELTFAGLGLERSESLTGELYDDKSKKLTEELESNERLLKMDPAVSLGILADQTGGLLTNNTNALDRAIDRINDDRRNHYLLSYVSTNSTLDGTYRKIEVRVPRADVEVRARRGYRASPNLTTAPVLEYEQPAMTALSVTPPPTAFPIAARAVHTPMPDRLGLVSVLVGVNGASLTLGRSEDGTQYLAGATVLARVVGDGHREVTRASQQYRFTGDYEQRSSHRRGVLFFRTAAVPAGTYTFEAVVYDVMGERNSVVRRPLEAIATSDRTVVGDLIVASRVEAAPEGQPGAAPHPLVWEGMLYTPSFGEPISLSAFDVTVALPMVVAGDAPQATLELRKGPETLKTLPLPTNTALPGGRLMLVGRLPIDDLSAGEYELRVTVTQDGGTVTRTARMTVVP